MKIDVLDNGFVSLITKPEGNLDLLVVNAARVSFAKYKEELDEKDEKLIKYLARENHWTPFGHPTITLHMCAPIFVRTQLFKHKVGFVENEISRRYVDFEPTFYVPSNFRSKPINAKQGSGDMFDKHDNKIVTEKYITAAKQAVSAYNEMIKDNVAPEIARGVLPQSMYTEWYWTGSLSAFARVVKLRNSKTAQHESGEYARAIKEIIQPLAPLSWAELVK